MRVRCRYAGADLDTLLARGAHAAAASALAQLATPVDPMPITLVDVHAAMDAFQPATFWAMQQPAGAAAEQLDLQVLLHP